MGLDYLQLHGDESPEQVARLKRNFPVIKAIRVRDSFRPKQLNSFGRASAILLDGFDARSHGGTGKTFNWNLARGSNGSRRIFLAGGLTPENVAEAIRVARPYAVDVCSGVEARPGRKDPARIVALMWAVKAAEAKAKVSSAPQSMPDAHGRFGPYGGRYVPETLVAPLEELELAYAEARKDPKFQAELDSLLSNFAGRPTPLQFASRLTEHLGGPRIYLKREDLLHTGAHKINNCIGQGLLAVRMGKQRVIAETGAGQHGVATATVAARLGLTCTVYMGTEDMERQRLNVIRMRLLGAEVIGVDSGSRTLKDAINEAMRDWVTNVATSHYLLGSVLGAHPYPQMVRDFHKVIGEEAREQIHAGGGTPARFAGGVRGRRVECDWAVQRVSRR